MTDNFKQDPAGPPLLLCIEDEDDLRRDLVDELEEAGYAVIEAADGAQALEQLRAARPDLILCDVNMPVRNGYELLRDIRKQHAGLADVPFVFLTALAGPREIADGKRSGADDYLVKPIDYDLLLATVEARLRQVSRMRRKAADEIEEVRAALLALGREQSSEVFNSAVRALDYIALGIVLLDGRGQVLFANRTAARLAEEGDGIVIESTVRAPLSQHSMQLDQVIAVAIAASLAGDDHVVGLPLPRLSGRRDLLLLACTLMSDEENSVPSPAVVLFISDPEGRPQVPASVLSSLFGLTPAEAKLATALAEGHRLDEIATELAVSSTTIAFHLRNLFRKTNTNRQADLIALVLAGPMAMSLQE